MSDRCRASFQKHLQIYNMEGHLTGEVPPDGFEGVLRYHPAATQIYVASLAHFARGYRDFLEIGSGDLISTSVFACIARMMDGRVWSIDIADVPNKAGVQPVTYIQSDSLAVEWNQMVDVLYVDGCHEADHVRKELAKYAKWVWRGGVILMDDMRHLESPTELEQVADEFCDKWGLKWKYCAPLPGKLAVIEVDRRIG